MIRVDDLIRLASARKEIYRKNLTHITFLFTALALPPHYASILANIVDTRLESHPPF
jgi:hypothetical protein